MGKEYQVVVNSFSCLSPEHFYESNLFELGGHGGYRWKLVIYRERGFEDVKLALVSCNNCGIRARIGWSIESGSFAQEVLLPNAAKAAVPFSVIDRLGIPLSDLTDSSGTLYFKFTVKVRISNVEQINRDELRQEKKDVNTVKLEIIRKDTILEWVENNGLGLVPPTGSPHSEVYHDSLLCYWGADDSLNYRYWLCKHWENGSLTVEKCLDAFSLWKCFGNVCTDIDGGIPWVTLFMEEKKNGEVFQPIDDDSIVVFCIRFDLSDGSETYLGHLICERNMLFRDLSKAIEKTMICTTYDESYQYCLIGNRQREDITDTGRTLRQYGFESGSRVLIMGPDSEGSFLDAETTRIFEQRYPGQEVFAGSNCEEGKAGTTYHCDNKDNTADSVCSLGFDAERQK